MARDAYDLSGAQILTKTIVQRIILEERGGEHIATRVQLARSNDKTISAAKEVVLSARVYRTPQILMLSGIGPKRSIRSTEYLTSLILQRWVIISMIT